MEFWWALSSGLLAAPLGDADDLPALADASDGHLLGLCCHPHGDDHAMPSCHADDEGSGLDAGAAVQVGGHRLLALLDSCADWLGGGAVGHLLPRPPSWVAHARAAALRPAERDLGPGPLRPVMHLVRVHNPDLC